VVKDALEAASPENQGVISATLAYHMPHDLQSRVRTYFEAGTNREALLDAMSRGLMIDGQLIESPRFCFNRRPLEALKVTKAVPDWFGDVSLRTWTAELPRARDALVKEGVDQGLLTEIVDRALSGDFRDLMRVSTRLNPAQQKLDASGKVRLILKFAAQFLEDERS
jgi:hypothetical protein